MLARTFRDFSSVFAEVGKNAETYFGSLCPGSNPGGVVDRKDESAIGCGILLFQRLFRNGLRVARM